MTEKRDFLTQERAGDKTCIVRGIPYRLRKTRIGALFVPGAKTV